MQPLIVVLILLAFSLIMGSMFLQLNPKTLVLPKAATRTGLSVEEFCTSQCRKSGNCPLTGTAENSPDCPLWRYDEAAWLAASNRPRDPVLA